METIGRVQDSGFRVYRKPSTLNCPKPINPKTLAQAQTTKYIQANTPGFHRRKGLNNIVANTIFGVPYSSIITPKMTLQDLPHENLDF